MSRSDLVTCKQCGYSDYTRAQQIILNCGNPEDNCCSGCPDCAGYCHMCDNPMLREDQYEHEGEYYCSGCHSDATADDRVEAGGSIFNYNENVLDHLNFQGDPKPGEPYFGVEVEVELRGDQYCSARDIAERVRDILGPENIVLKTDGSLNNGFEIVTAPATLARQRDIWEPFNDPTLGPRVGIKSFYTRTCGMHIHMSKWTSAPNKLVSYTAGGRARHRPKRIIGPLDWLKMRYFLCSNMKATAALCQRLSSSYAYWDRLPSRLSSDNNDKFSVINSRLSGTVEMRGFKGNLRYDRIIKGLEFTYGLLQYVQQVSCRDLRELTKARIGFVNYIMDSAKTFPVARAYLDELSGKGLPLDSEHVGYANYNDLAVKYPNHIMKR